MLSIQLQNYGFKISQDLHADMDGLQRQSSINFIQDLQKLFKEEICTFVTELSINEIVYILIAEAPLHMTYKE